MSKNKKFVPVVAVLNMKGGVGKTTLAANIFATLCEMKDIPTLLLDLDPQFNLTQSLFDRTSYEEHQNKEKTIAKIMESSPDSSIFTITNNDEPPPRAEDLIEGLFYIIGKEHVFLDIIPGDFRLVKYSLMDDNKKLTKVRERFLKFIKQSKERYGLIAIDCNPSSSFLTLCALHACTHILVPVRPDKYSVLGLEILQKFVDHVPSIHPKPQIFVVLNGMPRRRVDPQARAVESELRGHQVFGSRTLAAMIPHSALLSAKTDFTGFAVDRRGPWSDVVRRDVGAVSNELAAKLGI